MYMYVCRHHCCCCCYQQENRQFGRSRHLSDLYSKQICRNRWKTGLSMLWIVLHWPRPSQQSIFCPCLSTRAMCSLHMHITSLIPRPCPRRRERAWGLASIFLVLHCQQSCFQVNQSDRSFSIVMCLPLPHQQSYFQVNHSDCNFSIVICPWSQECLLGCTRSELAKPRIRSLVPRPFPSSSVGSENETST